MPRVTSDKRRGESARNEARATLRVLACVAIAWALPSGCSDNGRADGSADGDGGEVATDSTAGNDVSRDVQDVQPVDPCAPPVCGPRELCGVAATDGGVAEGNGLDDDCDGEVDEDCACTPGAAHACFPGPRDRRGVGTCRDGTAMCGELESWQTCVGAVLPAAEVCDGLDNNCDGRVDEELAGCANTLRCPASAGARPLTEFVYDGRTIDPGATAFAWTLQCPRTVSPCPSIALPADPTLRVSVIQSGTYRVEVSITRADGSVRPCSFPLYVQGTGLRVEMDWETRGGIDSSGVDMDLHLAPIDPRRATPATWFSLDDCYYATCLAPGGRVVWSTSPEDTRFAPTTDVTTCAGAPPPYGAAWRGTGRCWNPRLDTDDRTCDPSVTDPTRETFCFPENINVDVPPEDVTFRLAVNFYRDHGTCTDAVTTNDVTHPRLLVHCGGLLRAEIGGVDDGEVAMACARNPGLGSANWTWLAADVRFGTNACGLSDCTVRPLRVAQTRFPSCDAVPDADDVCQDGSGRVFVRRAGARPVDADLARSF